MKSFFIIAMMAGMTCYSMMAAGETTTQTVEYRGSRASNNKNNPCAGCCDQICKRITTTTTSLTGNSTTIATETWSISNGQTMRFTKVVNKPFDVANAEVFMSALQSGGVITSAPDNNDDNENSDNE